MKFTKSLVAILGITILNTSCSFLERHEEPVTDAPVTTTPSISRPRIATELSKMETKIAALETKVEVLSASLERAQLQRAQSTAEAKFQADGPQNSLSAPVSEAPLPTRVSAAPASLNDMETTANGSIGNNPLDTPKSLSLPSIHTNNMSISSLGSIGSSKSVEGEFRAAMEVFQMGSFSDASSKFRAISTRYASHPLASHALYWSGESNARAEQWTAAVEDWAKLEKSFSRSAYIPDALAGLSKAYAKLGETEKATNYKDLLLTSFPNAPAAMGLLKYESGVASSPAVKTIRTNPAKPIAAKSEPEIPAYEPGDENGTGTSE